MEREFYNPDSGNFELGYDDGIYETNPYLAPVQPPSTAPASAAPPPPGTPPPTGGGKTPQQIEQEGRDYDARNGLIGGYMRDGVWVNGSPMSNRGGGDTPGNPYEFGGGDDFDPSSFRWSPFNAPQYGGFENYTANPFEAPDPEQTANDPWLKFALKQGTNQLENSAAYQGMVRSGMNKARVLEHGVNFTRQFGNDVWNRAFQGWQANEDNRFRAWGGNRQNSLDTFDRGYRSASDQWGAQRDAEKMDFNARLQQWRDRLNATTQVATAGMGG